LATDVRDATSYLSALSVRSVAVVLSLEPGEERELTQVVEDDHDGEDQNADEGHLVDALFELLVKVAAHDRFDQEEEDHAAVEDGYG